MSQTQIHTKIEQDFIAVLEALSPKESQFNCRLLGKTKKVATMLAKLVKAREKSEIKSPQNGAEGSAT